MSTTTVTIDRLSKLFSGEPIPNLPDWNPQWSLDAYRLEQDRFCRRLLEYIRRLFAKLTDANILATLGGQGLADWRYHAATHKFQVQRYQNDGTIGDWEDAVADQPVVVTELNDWQYDTSSHKFQVKTQAFYALESASVSGWTDKYSALKINDVLTNVAYDDGTGVLSEDEYANVYVLELGSPSTVDIVTFEPCDT